MAQDIVRRRLVVDGRVQGVWYRQSTLVQAQSLGLRGWVRNLPDGRVEVLAQGHRDAVEKLISWCRRGPELAIVGNVRVVEESSLEELEGFQIIK